MLGYPEGFLLAKHPSAAQLLEDGVHCPVPAPYLHVEEGGKPLPEIGLGVTAQVPAGTRRQRPEGTAGRDTGSVGDGAGTPAAALHEVLQTPGDQRGQG